MQSKLSKEYEQNRLQALLRYEILDTPSEKELDDITKLTSLICEAPICLISLLDDSRQWFKSKVGIDFQESCKAISFCSYAIQQDEIFEVQNALLDKRFETNPFVVNAPFLRFYAGMPLRTPCGFNIGMLCIVDTKPRILNANQRYLLETLSQQVILNFELRLNNRELKVLSEETLKLAKAKDTFLSNMSHELRTPLNAIYGFTELIYKTKLDSSQKEYISTIKSSVEILVSIINDILDYSKLEDGKLKIENRPFNFRELIKGIYELLKLSAQAKNISFKINVEKNIPTYLSGDKVRLSQILMNLLGNAIKFTNKGSVILNIRSVIDNDKELVMSFSVRDTGIGIPSQKLNEIFDRFEQSHGKTSVYGGTGLGLCITRSLVELQEGKINVKSIYGKGSEFSFSLGYARLNESEISSIIAQEKTESLNAKRRLFYKLRILLVEDVDVNIRLIEKVVEGTGIVLDTAKNGRLCIEKLKEKEYDLILMDLQMPEMNGYEATYYIRNTMNLKTPIVAVSANISEIDMNKCLDIGMNDYLTKPFKIDQLFAAISKLINLDKFQCEDGAGQKKTLNLGVTTQKTQLSPVISKNSNQVTNSCMLPKHNNSVIKVFNFTGENSKSSINDYKISKSKLKNMCKEKSLPLILKSPKISNNVEPININTLKEYSGDDEEFEKEIMGKFLEEMPVYLIELESEISKENFISIRKAAHKMKSPVAMFGLNGLRDNLKEIEELSEKALINSIKTKFCLCKIQLQKNLKEIEMLLSEYN